MRQQPDPVAALLDQGRYQDALPLAARASEAAAPGPARADALERLGVAHRELGQYAEAEAALLQALADHAASRGKDHPEYARSMGALARLYEELARYPSAERLYRGALAVLRSTAGEDHPDTARCLHDLAGLCDQVGRLAEGADLREQAAAARARALPPDHPEQALSLLASAAAALRRDQLDQAERLAHRAADLLQGGRGEAHPDLATAWLLLSRVHVQGARLPEAEDLARRAVALRERSHGRRHQLYARALAGLALARAAGGHPDAEGHAREALSLTTAALGDTHPATAYALSALASILLARGDHAEAERLYEQALAALRAALGEGAPQLAGPLRGLAEACLAAGRPAEAEDHLRAAQALLRPHADLAPADVVGTGQALARALAAQNRLPEAGAVAQEAVEFARRLGPDCPVLLAGALDALARVHQAEGRLADAEPLWREVIAARRSGLGPHHPLGADALRSLAALLAARGELAEAMTLEEQAARAIRESLGEHHPQYPAALTSLAHLCALAGRPDRAEALLAEAAERQRERVGEDHLDHVRAVLQLARFYLFAQNAPAAEVRFRQVIAALERLGGDELPEYADALHDLGELCHQQGDLAAAEHLLEQAREARRERLGEGHPDVALSSLALAAVYQAADRLDDAGPLFRQAASALGDSLGEGHQATLRARHLEALYFLASNDPARGERQLLEVADRLRAAAGEFAPALVPVLVDLARAYGARGDGLAAEPLWQQVSRIHRTAFPDEAMIHAQDLANQALLLRALGELPQAEGLVRESLDHLRHARGPDHPELAAGLGLLAGLVQAQGRLDEAESLYRQAADLARSAFGQAHPVVAGLLVELAGLEASRGRLDQAESLYRQAADFLHRAQGEDNLDALGVQRQLAALLQAQGRLDEAESVLRARLAVLRRMFGATSPMLVPAQQLLAEACRQQGRLDEAESLARQALQSMERAAQAEPREGPPAGELGLGVALAQNNLAAILLAQNRPAEAAPLLRRALDLTLASVGEDHPAAAGALANLAALCARTGQEAEALAHYQRLAAINDRHLPQLLTLAPDLARAAACQGCQEHFEAFLALAARHLARGPAGRHFGLLVDSLFEQALRRKRFGMAALAASPWPLWAERYPEHGQSFRRLWLLDRQIAARRMAGPGPEGLARHEEGLSRWLRERDALEAALAPDIPELEEWRRALHADARSVSARLPHGWALVEFLIAQAADLDPPDGPGGEAPGRRFLVFVLCAGEGSPTLIDLGDADRIEQAALAWRLAVEAGAAQDEAARPLLDLLWRPLAPHLADSRGLALALDGELLHAPIAALPISEGGGALHERYDLRQVIAGRDLLRQPSTRTPRGEVVVLSAAGPDEAPSAAPAGWFARLLGALVPRRRPGPPVPTPPAGAAWGVAHAFGAPCHLGREATKARALSARRPRVLHLDVATFFLPGPTGPGAWETPLDKSGLVFPGDDRLTSHEVTALDLTGTELVILSGGTPAGELPHWGRLSALVHAFLHAGARNVLLALWKDREAGAPLARLAEAVRGGRSVAAAVRDIRREGVGDHRASRGWPAWAHFGGVGD